MEDRSDYIDSEHENEYSKIDYNSDEFNKLYLGKKVPKKDLYPKKKFPPKKLSYSASPLRVEGFENEYDDINGEAYNVKDEETHDQGSRPRSPSGDLVIADSQPQRHRYRTGSSTAICCRVVCFIICFILIYLIFFYFFYYLWIKEGDPFEFLRSDVKAMSNFDDNLRMCKANRANLPRPGSQLEEDLVIKKIMSVVQHDCEFLFFGTGFTADKSVRYQSLSGNMTWPSLKVMPAGFLPFDFKECYEIKTDKDVSLKTVAVKNCSSITGKPLLFLRKSDDESCNRHRFSCIEVYNSLPKDDVKTSFQLAKENNPNLLNLLPFDKDQPPESLQLMRSKLITKPTIVMAVKYNFVYKYGNKTQQYTSSRFSVVDPEYDCIAYDIKRDKVVTRDCEDTGCPVCSNKIT